MEVVSSHLFLQYTAILVGVSIAPEMVVRVKVTNYDVLIPKFKKLIGKLSFTGGSL